MSPAPVRQTNWKALLITVGGIVLVGFLFLKLFWFPWELNNNRLARMEEDYNKKRLEFLTFMKEKSRLQRDRLLGMPRDLLQGGNDYRAYFQALCKKCGVTIDDSHGPAHSTQALMPGKKPGHIPLTYSVHVHGGWAGLVKLLEQFQRTPLLHRLRGWSIEQKSVAKDKTPDKLAINMTIEMLMVGRNQQRPDNLWGVDPRLVALDGVLAWHGQPSGWAMLLRGQALLPPRLPSRRYGELAVFSPFSDLSPAAQAGIHSNDKNKDKDKIKADMPIRLAIIANKKALLVLEEDKDKQSSITLASTPGKDTLDTLQFTNGMKGKCLRVDARDIYLQVGTEVFDVQVGQYLTEARPLSPQEVKDLGLPGKPAP